MSAMSIILIVAFPALDSPVQNSTEIRALHMSARNMTKALNMCIRHTVACTHPQKQRGANLILSRRYHM